MRDLDILVVQVPLMCSSAVSANLILKEEEYDKSRLYIA